MKVIDFIRFQRRKVVTMKIRAQKAFTAVLSAKSFWGSFAFNEKLVNDLMLDRRSIVE